MNPGDGMAISQERAEGRRSPTTPHGGGASLHAIHADTPLLGPTAPASVSIRTGMYPRIVKPCIDRLAAAALLLVLAPALIVISIAIASSLGRPIFFRQRRVGAGGRTFDVMKFRTMATDRRGVHLPLDEEQERRVTHKSDSDPRLNRVGRFLRKYSLDELPQLFNVLNGDMSLVGPRPELVHIVADYHPSTHSRHAVKPGMTGLWQVAARGDGLMHENPELDVEYAEQQSFLLDTKILLKTPAAALFSQQGL